MAKALSKSQVAAAIAEKNGFSKKQAVEVLESRQLLTAPVAYNDSYSIAHLHTLTTTTFTGVLGRPSASLVHSEQRAFYTLDLLTGS